MIDGETLALLERIAVAIERIAERYAPKEAHREPRQAVLTTATYSREERERKELRDTLHGKPRKVATSLRTDL